MHATNTRWPVPGDGVSQLLGEALADALAEALAEGLGDRFAVGVCPCAVSCGAEPQDATNAAIVVSTSSRSFK
jgi:hypothetical protein